MSDRSWTLDGSDGELLLHTGVTGTAARMGHRLTIAVRTWHATVTWDSDEPAAVEVTVDLDSLDVLRGEGGVTPLTGAEKTSVRTNAWKTLRVKRFPQARFRSTEIERDADAYQLTGVLEIGGKTGDQIVDVRVTEKDISGEAVVCHSAFGIKQYSMLMGAIKVADEVRVTLASTRTNRAARHALR